MKFACFNRNIFYELSAIANFKSLMLKTVDRNETDPEIFLKLSHIKDSDKSTTNQLQK
jgi:hypothetical protein